MIKKYRKKPVVIEAMQLRAGMTDKEAGKVAKWCGGSLFASNQWHIVIHTLEGDMTANQGDYIIKGVQGEFYPCKPDIFEATYEEVGIKKERAVFNLLWDMYNTARNAGSPGQVIGRYASMIDDRIENSGYSRSVDSLKLYTTEQLQDELDSRKES